MIELLEEPPNRLHIFWFVGNVWVLEIYPVADFLRKIVPDVSIAHHGISAGLVVVFHRDFFTDIFFCDAEFFLHAEFYG